MIAPLRIFHLRLHFGQSDLGASRGHRCAVSLFSYSTLGWLFLIGPGCMCMLRGGESNHPKDWQTPKPSGRCSQLQSSDVAPDTTVFCSGEGLSSAFSSLGLHTIWAQDAENIVLASINLHANWVRSFSDNLVFWFLLVLGLRAYTCPHDLMLL